MLTHFVNLKWVLIFNWRYTFALLLGNICKHSAPQNWFSCMLSYPSPTWVLRGKVRHSDTRTHARANTHTDIKDECGVFIGPMSSLLHHHGSCGSRICCLEVWSREWNKSEGGRFAGCKAGRRVTAWAKIKLKLVNVCVSKLEQYETWHAQRQTN